MQEHRGGRPWSRYSCRGHRGHGLSHGLACSAVLERSAAPRPIIRRTRARPRGPMRDPRHAPAESCMRRCLPILALALLLARPALAQEQPVDAQGDEPPTGAIEPEDDPEAARSAERTSELQSLMRIS